LFVVDGDEGNLGIRERLEDGHVLLARKAKNAADPFLLEAFDKRLGNVWHPFLP
jgi:hypothetical protein